MLLLGACAELAGPGESPLQAPARSVAEASADDDYVATPAGLYHRSCVHEIPADAVVENERVVRRKDGRTFQIPACRFAPLRTVPARAQDPPGRPAQAAGGVQSPTINGWVEYTSATSSGPYKRITADWRVPPAPQIAYSTPRKVYYTFPGLQNGSYIIQPVLQYGNNGEYGGAYWTITSWRCNSGSDCLHSPPVTVSSGDLIRGDVSASACSAGVCTWTITTLNTRTGQSTVHTVRDDENYYWATSGAVEVYNLNSCLEFPAHGDYRQSGVFYSSVAVWGPTFNPVTPSWSANITPGLSPSCNFRVTSTGTTANLHHAPDIGGYITGPLDISRFQSAQYTAFAQYGSSPYTYQWRLRHSPDGFSWGAWSPWSSPSANNYTYTSVNSCGIRRVHLQVMVTDVEGRSGIGSDFYIGVLNPC